MRAGLNLLLLLAVFKLVSCNRLNRGNSSDIVISDSDCQLHLTCTDCVSSQCDWCVEAGRCTHDSAEQCTKNDIVVKSATKGGQTVCPAIHPSNEGSTILMAAGGSKSIRVKVHINSPFIIQARFACQFMNTDGHVKSVGARLLGDTIYCDPMQFDYASNTTIPFAVVWGGDKPLDNPDNIQVFVYRCNDMCDNCAACLALPEKYNCGWCQSKSTCEVVNQCSANNENNDDWLNRSLLNRCTN